MDLDKLDIKEVKISVHSFDVKGSKVYCMLFDGQVSVMNDFFKKIDDGLSWEDAKNETINTQAVITAQNNTNLIRLFVMLK